MSRILDQGMDQTKHTEVRVQGVQHHLTRVPLDDVVVCVLRRGSEQEPVAWQQLTPRELDVRRLLAGGGTTSSVAHELDLSSATVRTHIENMRGKMGVQNECDTPPALLVPVFVDTHFRPKVR